MAEASPTDRPHDAVQRAIAWHHARHEAICDSITPWEYGVVARASRYPSYWDFNVVRVERRPDLDPAELVAFAERALSGLGHVRLDFDVAADGQPFRAQLVPLGWRATELLLMRHDGDVPQLGIELVEEVPYDAVAPLRVAWHEEDFPGLDDRGYAEQAREVSARRNARVLAAMEHDEPVGFAQLESRLGGSEIELVYVRRDRRGQGLGTALTSAAIAAAAGSELWIYADADDRPRLLYERLGFRPVHTILELTRLP
jgi:GNAT superfamily N-acetyltransferase